jgi:hypothetical protein
MSLQFARTIQRGQAAGADSAEFKKSFFGFLKSFPLGA